MENFNHRREEELALDHAMFCFTYCQFRVMFGVGMVWAGSGIYSSTAFLLAMAVYSVAQVILLMFSKLLS